jgi:hypothetical protein
MNLGALVYRLFRGERKKKLKLLHAATMFTAFFITVFALKAAFDSHNQVHHLFVLKVFIQQRIEFIFLCELNYFLKPAFNLMLYECQEISIDKPYFEPLFYLT